MISGGNNKIDFLIVIFLVCQTSAAKKRKKKNKQKQRSATTIENGDASSTTSTINDGADSLDHTHEPLSPISEAPDTRIPHSPVTSGPDSLEAEVSNGSVGLPNGSGKEVPPPVLIHVGDKASNGLPNGFVSGKSKLATNSSASKGSRPVTLGKSHFMLPHINIASVCHSRLAN